jgi:hypothetical protein
MAFSLGGALSNLSGYMGDVAVAVPAAQQYQANIRQAEADKQNLEMNKMKLLMEKQQMQSDQDFKKALSDMSDKAMQPGADNREEKRLNTLLNVAYKSGNIPMIEKISQQTERLQEYKAKMAATEAINAQTLEFKRESLASLDNSRNGNLKLKQEDLDRKQKEFDKKMLQGSQPMTTDELQSAGAAVRSGQPVNQVIPGYGKDAVAKREAARMEAVRQMTEENPDISPIQAGEILSQNQINYAAQKSGKTAQARTLGTLEANIVSSSTEAIKMSNIVRDISKDMDLGNYKSINQVENAVATHTGGENIVKLNAALNGFTNTYSRAINPKGVPTVADKEHVREVINNAMSKGQLNSVLDVLGLEMDAALASPEAARKILDKAGKISMKEPSKNQEGLPAGWSVKEH